MTLTAEASASAQPATTPLAAGFTIEIDTGGTFTDGYVTGAGRVVVAKADTTPYDLAVGVLAAIDHAAEQLELSRLDLLRRTSVVRLSTTVGTNTLINRDGPAIGLLIGRSLRPVLADLATGLPVDLDLVQDVTDSAGEIDPAEVQHGVRQLLEHGARVVVIALAGGPDLPARENEVRNAIAGSYPRHYLGAVPVLPSHQVTPLADGRLRIHTAVLNAYLHPVMSRFLYRVEEALRIDGYPRPLLIANANGGTSRVAKTSALRTWGSGPAGGVSASTCMAIELDAPVAVGFDVGGTSTDVAVILDGAWKYEVQPTIEGVEVALPVLSLVSAPLGGGTIARVVDGELRLGPDSAGAQPGPACFGLGGDNATVTDAVCFLGLFDAEHFLGGRKHLDVDEAADVLAQHIAAPLGVPVEVAARRVVDAAAHAVADAIRTELRTAGAAPEHAVLFATGGAGGMLATAVHDALGARETVAFPVSPVFSAFGLSRLDALHTYEVSADAGDLAAELDAAASRAVADMRTEGIAADRLVFRHEAEFADSTGNVVVVDVEPGTEPGSIDSHGPEGHNLRLVRLVVSSPTRRAELPMAGDRGADANGWRDVRWSGDPVSTPVVDWLHLAEDTLIEGPAVLETTETTLAVPPGATVRIGHLGEARITTRSTSASSPTAAGTV